MRLHAEALVKIALEARQLVAILLFYHFGSTCFTPRTSTIFLTAPAAGTDMHFTHQSKAGALQRNTYRIWSRTHIAKSVSAALYVLQLQLVM